MTRQNFAILEYWFSFTTIFILFVAGCDSPSTKSAKNFDNLAQQTSALGGRAEVIVDLAHTDTSDDDLANMEFHDNVTQINLSHTKVSDVGLVQLERARNLERLNLSGTRISDASVDRLKAMPKLYQVDLQNSLISPEKQAELVKFFSPRFNAHMTQRAAAASKRP